MKTINNQNKQTLKTKLNKLMTLAIALFTIGIVNAQTNTFPTTGSAGIGTTTPNASSVLEVKSTTKGMLTPRMTQSQRNAIPSPANGLLIYQTDFTKGFYYYNGNTWKPVSASGWGLTGNAGTNPSTNFIGTTDNAALKFRVENLNAGQIDATSGNTALGARALNISAGTNNTAFGRWALLNNSANDNTAIGSQALTQNTSGFSLVGVGLGALGLNTTGFNNTASGYESLYSNLDGNQNTAFGCLSLFNNTSGGNNTGCGMNALYSNNTGSHNTAIGINALYSNTSGSWNTAIGYNAAVGSGGLTNATAIGANATVSASNSLVLGNGANVGIGTTAPTSPLTVSGNFYQTPILSVTNIGNSYEQYGIRSESMSSTNGALNRPILGVASGSSYVYNYGLYGYTTGNWGAVNYAVYGYAGGMYGTTVNYAGYFDGNVNVTGTFSNVSDRKFKKNIQPVENVLSKILQLNPSTYEFKTDEFRGMNLSKGKHFGLIAQELEKVFPEFVSDNVHAPMIDEKTKEKVSDEIKYKGVNYIELIPVLIAGMQEQQKQIEGLKSKLSSFDSIVHSSDNSRAEQIILSVASLEQNTPNPFSENTTISFNIPSSVKTAMIKVLTAEGREVKSSIITERGNTSINLSGNSLSAGNYIYQLVVDGKTVDSKKMTLTK